MSPRRRTLSFLFILLSVNNGLASCEIPPGYSANPNGPSLPLRSSLFNVASPSELLAAAQRLLPGSQWPIMNEGTAQPIITESATVSVPSSSQPSLIGIDSFGNLPIPNAQAAYSTIPTNVPTSEVLPVESFQASSSLSISPSVPQQENSGSLGQTYFPTGPAPLGLQSFDQATQPNSVPETLNADYFSQDLSQIYQSPITVQVPSMPAITPFIALATPVPSKLPQNIPVDTYTSNALPAYYQGTVNSQIIDVPSLVNTASFLSPANIDTTATSFEYSSGYAQQPLSLQINMPSAQPASEQPIILLSPTSSAPLSQDYSSQSMPPIVPPSPLIIMERSKSKWKHILPILLISLFDGCGSGCSDCGCSGGSNIPYPYPIPIPTNNPIIRDRRKGKKKSSSDRNTTSK